MDNIKIVKKIIKDLTLYIGVFGTMCFMCTKEDGYLGEILILSSIPIINKSIDHIADIYIRKRDK